MIRISMPPTTSPTRRGPSQPAASRGRNSRACCVRRSSGRPSEAPRENPRGHRAGDRRL